MAESWQSIAHRLAARVFLGYCQHAEHLDQCPGCRDRAAVVAYREKCRASDVQYAGQAFNEEMARTPSVALTDIPESGDSTPGGTP